MSKTGGLIERLNRIILTSIPLYMIGNKTQEEFLVVVMMSILVEFMMPIFSSVSTIWSWFFRKKVYVMTIKPNCDQSWEYNGIYQDISHFMKTYIDKLAIYNIYSYRNYGDKFTHMSDGELINYNFKNDIIKVSKVENKSGDEKNLKCESHYKLASKSFAIINSFLEWCSNERCKALKEEMKKFYYSYQFNDKNWVCSKINTIKTFDNIFLPLTTKNKLLDSVKSFISNKEFYRDSGIPYKIGFMFYGKPGCGKTSSIYAIAHYFERNIYTLNIGEIFSTETKEKFRQSIRDINPGNIIVIEDIDTYSCVSTREEKTHSDNESTSSESSEKTDSGILKDFLTSNKPTSSSLGILLEIFDGYNYLDDTIIIITTNHPEKIDPALIRPGRIDHKVCFNYLTLDQVNIIMKFFYKSNPSVTIDSIDKLCEMTPAEFINTHIMSNLTTPENIVELFS